MSGSNNGGNPRLDRIEKLIEQTVRATKEAERANKEAHARHKQEMRQIRGGTAGVGAARRERGSQSKKENSGN